MKIIVGLGNPEPRYDNTRHNTGFTIIDALAQTYSAQFKPTAKFKATTAGVSIAGEKVLLVKPTTYYNLVGESVRAVVDFYKVTASDVLVIHDELALPFGTVRVRTGGSDAGNNGVKSLTAHLGADTLRLRIGIWSDLRDRMDDADFVLAKFSAQERTQLVTIAAQAIILIERFVTDTLEPQTLRVEVE